VRETPPKELRHWFDFAGRGPRCRHDRDQPAEMCRVCGPEYRADVASIQPDSTERTPT